MTKFEKMDNLLKQQGGILKTTDIINEGISKTYFLDYVNSRNLVRVARGTYLSQDAWSEWSDWMYLLQIKYKQGVFSHETALFLHKLTDMKPTQYSMTVKTGYNPTNMTGAGIKVYTVKKELHELGIMKVTTPFGYSVNTYNPERTICDIARSRSTVGLKVFQNALKQYSGNSNKNLQQLLIYSKQFRIEKILLQYMEMFL